MALEVSIVASASRLQAQSDQRTELARARQREEAIQRAREAERLVEDRVRADISAANTDSARLQREFVRNVDDAKRFDALIARDTEDARIDERIAREEADLRQFLADERIRTNDQNAAFDAQAPLTPTTPPAARAEDVPPEQQPRQASFEDLLAGRNARLAERAAADRQFIETQNRDFNRSVRSIEELQTNPIALPEQPQRGAVVDFSA